LPSGDHAYAAIDSLLSVSLRPSPPSAGISQISDTGPSPSAADGVPPSRADRKLMRLPSGDHAGDDSPRSLNVSCRAPEPSAATRQMCDRASLRWLSRPVPSSQPLTAYTMVRA